MAGPSSARGLPVERSSMLVPSEAGALLWQSRNMRFGSCSQDSHLLVRKKPFPKRRRGAGKLSAFAQCIRRVDSPGKGAIALPNVSWIEASRLCLAHCLSCKHCNYVSLSVERGYCAWHTVCNEEALYLPRQYDVFTAHVPKSEHAWLARRPDPVDDAPPKPSRLQVQLDAAMRHRPLRDEQPGARGLHYREACLQKNGWVLAIGTSVMRIFFMRLVEEHVVMNQARMCLPGWRFQSHGVCNSLKRGSPCVIDVRSNSSAGSMRFTFVWAFGWAQRVGDVGYRMSNHDAIGNKNHKQFSDSEAAAGRVLVGRFGAQSAAILKQLLHEAPRAPDLLLVGPDAWNLRDPPGLRASNVASFLDYLLGSHLTASGTTCVWLGARQSSGHYRRIGSWQQTLAEFEQEEARLRNVVAARSFVYLDPALLPPCVDHTGSINLYLHPELAATSPPGSQSCAVQDCSGYRNRIGELHNCPTYGRNSCHFAGECAGPHVYGRALSHLLHALLRSVCDVRSNRAPLAEVDPREPPSLENAEVFEQRWKKRRRSLNASLDAVARAGNGSKPRKLAITCAPWYKPRHVFVARRRSKKKKG